MIALSEDQREWLTRRAFQSAPQESCGFILSSGRIVEIRNICPNPNRGFNMDPIDVLNKLGREWTSDIIAVWHTHPSGIIHPSKTDQNAIFDGSIIKDWTYIIATKDEVAQWDTKTLAAQDDSFWQAFVAQ